MKRFSLLLTAILIFCFCACSNENEYSDQTSPEGTTIKAITSVADMPEEIQKIIAESKPYISPELQELMNEFDTLTTVPSIEEASPFLFSGESSVATFATKASPVPATVLTGYSNFETILNPITLSLTSYSSSALRQSLGISETLLSANGGLCYLRFYAFTQFAYYSTPISFMVAMPVENDWIGIDPAGLTSTSNVNNNVSLPHGFTVTPYPGVPAGMLYSLTTYVLGFSTANNAVSYYLLPTHGLPNAFDDSLYSRWGQKIEWTVLAM